MKKTKKMLNEKLQVKLPESLSTENIMANIENSKAEIVTIEKKKNNFKKIVPLVASLLLVVGIVGIYISLQQKDVPVQNNDDKAEVVAYQSYDKIYEKFDALHKEAEKNNKYNGFVEMFYATESDGASMEIADEESVASGNSTGAVADDMGATIPETQNMNDSAATGTSSANKEHGTTNTQEKDVDEGDIIKTDGNYLYVANGDMGEAVSIVDVTGEKMVEASQIDLEDTETVKEIYIVDKYLVIVGYLQAETDAEEKQVYSTYDCIVYFANDTFVNVYDISNRKEPVLVTEYSQQGNYDNSRMIGTKLYTISEYNVNVYSDDYRDNCIPETTINDVCEPVPAGCISIIEESTATSYAVITTLDISKNTDPESEAILGACNHLYASSKGLFLSETATEEMQEITKIYKFEYTDTGVQYKCTGKVKGYINDQFSMSYDGEYFRVATTANNAKVDGDIVSMSIDDRTNNLYILNNQMQIAGKVEDLAKGELIESVRFVGDMAYVVTFRQTDPLFVIDLSDPENPTVKGELKIPGFSEYLHPITENLLIGVGQDGTQTGTNGDCKVSLFDVSNPYEPKESSVLKVTGGGAFCHTPVSHKHKLYITLSETEFAVPFFLDFYVDNGKPAKGGNFYIRYKLQNGELCEVERYYLGDKTDVLGATYVENNFYVVNLNYKDQTTEIVAFDLTTHKEIDRITTYEK